MLVYLVYTIFVLIHGKIIIIIFFLANNVSGIYLAYIYIYKLINKYYLLY